MLYLHSNIGGEVISFTKKRDYMKDTLEPNLQAENSGMSETAQAPEITPENISEESNVLEETEETNSVTNNNKLSKEEILDKLAVLVEQPVEEVRLDVETLKQAFYKTHRAEIDEARKAFVEAGNDEKDFSFAENETDKRIKELLNTFKEKKAAVTAEDERTKAANYALKLQLIEQLKSLCESQEDFNKLYGDFKNIQTRWKEAKDVPAEHANELWRNYQIYCEKFYDIIKINNQFRDYDFKKNLEMKTALCETVERLSTEPDIISVFHQLQKLHQQWREIGPVAKDFREKIWIRFKTASTIINKRYQEYFEQQKAKEKENLVAKIKICEKIEAIDYSSLKTYKDWDKKHQEITELQSQWKEIGYAPKKENVKIYERFHAACDVYYAKRKEFHKTFKENMEQNLEQKQLLCKKAEALKDSTEWRQTTEKFIALQKEWKEIGPVPRKYSDTIWKRFITACDYFFDQKNKNLANLKDEENNNLTLKKEIVEKISSIDESLNHEDALSALRNLMKEWNSIGFVPIKEKDKIYKAYHEAVDRQFERLNIDEYQRKIETFRNSVNDSGKQNLNRLYSEREKLMRTYEKMKNELQTYENNMGFLTIASKGGNGLIKEMERKIEKLKNDMELIVKKIDAIDENIE